MPLNFDFGGKGVSKPAPTLRERVRRMVPTGAEMEAQFEADMKALSDEHEVFSKLIELIDGHDARVGHTSSVRPTFETMFKLIYIAGMSYGAGIGIGAPRLLAKLIEEGKLDGDDPAALKRALSEAFPEFKAEFDKHEREHDTDE